MRAHTLPAAAGWRWLRDGLRLLARNPFPLVAIVTGYWIVLMLLNYLVPLLGSLVATVLIPVLTAGVMNACRETAIGRPIGLRLLFSGFQDQPLPLVRLGVAGLLLSTGVLIIATLSGADAALTALLPTDGKTAPPTEGQILWGSLILIALLLPAAMACWFAPLLTAWHQVPPLKSLFFSLVAVWMNRWAFVVYVGTLAFFGILIPQGLLLLLAALSEGASSLLGGVLSVAFFSLLLPLMSTSLYISYRDVFAFNEEA